MCETQRKVNGSLCFLTAVSVYDHFLKVPLQVLVFRPGRPVPVCCSYLAVAGALGDGVEPVAAVSRRPAARTADGLQVLQAEERELLPVLPASHGLLLAPVLSEGLAGPLQHGVDHQLVHGAGAPAHGAVVGVAAALRLPALQQAASAEAVVASDHDWLAEEEATEWTGEVQVQPSAPAAGHSSSPGEASDNRQAAKAPAGPAHGNIILTLH